MLGEGGKKAQIRIADKDHRPVVRLRRTKQLWVQRLDLPQAQMRVIQVIAKERRGAGTPKCDRIVVKRLQRIAKTGAGAFRVVEEQEAPGVRNDYTGAFGPGGGMAASG